MNLKKSKPIIINKKTNIKNINDIYHETYEYDKIIIHAPIKSFKVIDNKIISLKFLENKKLKEVNIFHKYKYYNIKEIKIKQLQAELYYKNINNYKIKKYIYK